MPEKLKEKTNLIRGGRAMAEKDWSAAKVAVSLVELGACSRPGAFRLQARCSSARQKMWCTGRKVS